MALVQLLAPALVAPFTGAWIEIPVIGCHEDSVIGRALHGRVD